MKLEKRELESLEMDLIAIRQAGSVESYAASRKSTERLIRNIERLLAELKEAKADD